MDIERDQSNQILITNQFLIIFKEKYGVRKYTVRVLKKYEKKITQLPEKDINTLVMLLEDIEQYGPVQPKYQNFSKIGKNKYHCHLSYHWVACWQEFENEFYVEVYYVGSRENAPY